MTQASLKLNTNDWLQNLELNPVHLTLKPTGMFHWMWMTLAMMKMEPLKRTTVICQRMIVTKHHFLFQQQGQLVAVFCWDDYFIGQVTKIESETRSEVNFMENTTGNGQHQGFRCPFQEDQCSVQSDVVFAADISTG